MIFQNHVWGFENSHAKCPEKKERKQNEHAKNGNIQMTPIYLKYDKIFSKHIVTHQVANDCMPRLL